jgi:hypothetical protein
MVHDPRPSPGSGAKSTSGGAEGGGSAPSVGAVLGAPSLVADGGSFPAAASSSGPVSWRGLSTVEDGVDKGVGAGCERVADLRGCGSRVLGATTGASVRGGAVRAGGRGVDSARGPVSAGSLAVGAAGGVAVTVTGGCAGWVTVTGGLADKVTAGGCAMGARSLSRTRAAPVTTDAVAAAVTIDAATTRCSLDKRARRSAANPTRSGTYTSGRSRAMMLRGASSASLMKTSGTSSSCGTAMAAISGGSGLGTGIGWTLSLTTHRPGPRHECSSTATPHARRR